MVFFLYNLCIKHEFPNIAERNDVSVKVKILSMELMTVQEKRIGAFRNRLPPSR